MYSCEDASSPKPASVLNVLSWKMETRKTGSSRKPWWFRKSEHSQPVVACHQVSSGVAALTKSLTCCHGKNIMQASNA